jgi:hypothetical protein
MSAEPTVLLILDVGDEVRGYPDTIARDLRVEDGGESADCRIEYDESTMQVVVIAEHSNAAKWLIDFLNNCAQYYRRQAGADGERKAAEDLSQKVYTEVKE